MTKASQETVSYNDRIVGQFLAASFIWGVLGLAIGLVLALQLMFWSAQGSWSFLSFGRLRPIHTNILIYAFAGNSFFAGLYYSLQRLCRSRLWSELLSRSHFFLWQLIILAMVLSLSLGKTQGKEYAEMEWPLDILVCLAWLLMAVNVFVTIARRQLQGMYVSVWFYIASITSFFALYMFNALAYPVAFWQSYPLFAGVQDAAIQWWFGHNLISFFLTMPFLGLMYYFIPKAVGQAIYSYRLAMLHFWSLVLLQVWTGPQHLLYTALPEWAQSLGMVFAIMLIAPSFAAVVNGFLTLKFAGSRLYKDPVLRFFALALLFYGLTIVLGALQAIKSVNLYLHFTDFTIAHVHGATLGWLSSAIFAMAYYLVPRLWGRSLYRMRLAYRHFWLSAIGTLLYVASMYGAGLVQGTQWMARDELGLLRYPQFMNTVIALRPFYWGRLLGGLLFLLGVLVCAYNFWQTARSGRLKDKTFLSLPEREGEPRSLRERIERQAWLLAVLATLGMLFGSAIELIPLLKKDWTEVPNFHSKPYTPLELAGRDLYVRDGCHGCHTQQVRAYFLEELRYGPASKAEEFAYDRPFQWGSKRSGPDLHRLGGKYSDLWLYKHLRDPRSITSQSTMPAYPWLFKSKISLPALKKNLAALHRLGVPYDSDTLENPELSYRAQAKGIISHFNGSGLELTEYDEIVAMIAYLQKLGRDYGADTQILNE